MKNFDRFALAFSYLLMIGIVSTIGWIVEHNSNQTQGRVCATLRAQIAVNAELALYFRALDADVAISELEPTKQGEEARQYVNSIYEEACGVTLD